MDGLLVAVAAACDLPDRRLVARTLPVRLATVADGVEAGLVLPVVVAAAEHEAALHPDQLRPDGEARRPRGSRQRSGRECRRARRRRRRPEQRPRCAPVAAIVVADGAGARRRRDPGLVAPAGLVVHPVRRIGDHEVRPGAVQQPRHVVRRRSRPRTAVDASRATRGRPAGSPGRPAVRKRRPRLPPRPPRPSAPAAGPARGHRSR